MATATVGTTPGKKMSIFPIETCGPLLLYYNSEDTPFFHELTSTIEHTHNLIDQSECVH